MPFVCIRTTWSDDTKTTSPPLEEWYAEWLLLAYGLPILWGKSQIRPVRAILCDRHYWPVEPVPVN